MPQNGFEEGFTVASSGSIDTWVKEIHAKVPGAIESYIYDQVKLVIKDFFLRTKVWRRFLGPFTIAANDGQINLNPVDAYSNVIMVLEVVRNGSAMVQVDKRALPRYFATEQSSRNPSRYYLDPYYIIKLWPVPVVDVEEIYVTVALTPRLRADNRIDQWIIDQFYEAIKAGALQRLYEEPGKVYTNKDSASYWGKKYRAELARGRSKGNQEFGEMPQPWSYNKWVM